MSAEVLHHIWKWVEAAETSFLSVSVLQHPYTQLRIAILAHAPPILATRLKPAEIHDTFAAIADFAPGMMWLSTRDGGRTFFNKIWLGFTGGALGAELGMGWVANIHDEDRARAITAYHAGVRSGRPFELEYRLRRVDGVFRHVLDRAAPSLADGAIAGFVGSCLAITERTTAELALRPRVQLFRLLAENARDVLYRYRIYPSFACEYVSP